MKKLAPFAIVAVAALVIGAKFAAAIKTKLAKVPGLGKLVA